MEPAEVLSFYSQFVGELTEFGQNGQAKGFCPFHTDKENKSFCVDLKTSRFICFSDVCKKNGNAITFSRLLNVSPPRWAGGKDWGAIYAGIIENSRDEAKEYLLRRHLFPEYVNYLEEANLFGQDEWQDELSLVLPIFDEYGNICSISKINVDDNSKRIYGSYHNGYWVDTNFKFTGKIFITEAIVNAMTLNSMGYNALSMISSSNNLDVEMFIDSEVVLVLDNDGAGRAASRRLSRSFSDSSIPISSVVWDSELKKGFDPNDIIKSIPKAKNYIGKLLDKSVKIDEFSDFMRFNRLVRTKRQ